MAQPFCSFYFCFFCHFEINSQVYNGTAYVYTGETVGIEIGTRFNHMVSMNLSVLSF